MSVTRQWMLILILTAAMSVAVHSLVLSTLINRYYTIYSSESYNEHVTQLADFSAKVITETSYSKRQLEMHFETHLTDSINRIRLYDLDGHLLADVQADTNLPFGVMNRDMMRNMMGNLTEETEAIDIIYNGEIVGQLLISKISSFGSNMASRMFTVSLIGNSLVSFIVVFALIIVVGAYVSRKMSHDLKMTAKQATDIGLGNQQVAATSRVLEIRSIQQSLEELQTRIRLKQISRKKLVDELIHQTRTPLAILRTHLEGLADGVLQFSPEEIKTCEAQIENLDHMITNISSMIEAERDADKINIERIEIRQLLKQIADSLKIQFARKNIQLNMPDRGKFEIRTDRYKLSQAIYNLLTNAYKFTDSGGLVNIDFTHDDHNLIISVQDTGAGIIDDDKDRIFKPYFRGSNSGKSSGEGIGLYIAKENLQKIGGQLSLESTSGAGSTFTIILPLENNS